MFRMHADKNIIYLYLNYFKILTKIYGNIVERYNSVTETWILSSPFGHKSQYHRLVLPLHKNNPIGLLCKSIGWFLYNGNTANNSCYLFQILILTWLKTFFTIFPKLNLARLISQKQLKNCQTIATNTFVITRIIIKLIFIPPQFTENNNFNIKDYNQSRYFSRQCLLNILILNIYVQNQQPSF